MPLAQSSATEILNILAPLALGCLGVIAVLVTVLARHQRKMAEILHKPSQAPDALLEELRLLRQENVRLEAKIDALAQGDLAQRLAAADQSNLHLPS